MRIGYSVVLLLPAGAGRCLIAISLLLVARSVAQTRVPPSHLANLHRGVNVGRFRDGTLENDSYKCCEMRDVDLIRQIGFDHIRVLVEPGLMFDFNKPGLIPGKSLDSLDKLVQNCVSRQEGRKPVGIILAVTLDEFTLGQPRFRNKLGSDPSFPDKLAAFWQGFANHYSTSDSSDLVFFEVLNEPGLNEYLTDMQWAVIQAKLADAIRRGATAGNTILATGAQKSDVFGLLALPQLLDDGNVIYLFHYYEPYSFTHQGENWNASWAQSLKPGEVRYPYTAESVKKAAESVGDLTQRLDASHDMELAIQNRIEVDIEAVADWQQRQKVKVPLICDEFGVINNPNRGDRARWLKDVRELLEKEGIGWTVWDYSSERFGLLTKTNQFDKDAIEALGLKVSAVGP